MGTKTILEFPQIESLIEEGVLYALIGTGTDRDKKIGAYAVKETERRAGEKNR